MGAAARIRVSRDFPEQAMIDAYEADKAVYEVVYEARNRPGWVERVLPLPIGPVFWNSPRWVDEGYATLVEGALTGSGRPSSTYRAMVSWWLVRSGSALMPGPSSATSIACVAESTAAEPTARSRRFSVASDAPRSPRYATAGRSGVW